MSKRYYNLIRKLKLKPRATVLKVVKDLDYSKVAVDSLLEDETFECIKKNVLNKREKIIGQKSKQSAVKSAKPRAERKRKRRLRYKDYIVSELWEERKNKYYRRFGRRCRLCGSVFHVQLHHTKYGDYGKEKNKHLVALCETHHALFHSLYPTKKNMVNQTREFLRIYR